MESADHPAEIRVEVAYARADVQRLVPLALAAGSTAREAVIRSGLLEAFPEIAGKDLDLGVFSRPITLDTPLEHGDRVEIYRPLNVDPKEQRRKRARAQKAEGHTGGQR